MSSLVKISGLAVAIGTPFLIQGHDRLFVYLAFVLPLSSCWSFLWHRHYIAGSVFCFGSVL